MIFRPATDQRLSWCNVIWRQCQQKPVSFEALTSKKVLRIGNLDIIFFKWPLIGHQHDMTKCWMRLICFSNAKPARFFGYLPNPHTYFCAHVFCIKLPQMAWLRLFSLTPLPWPEIELTSVQLDFFWGTFTQDALPNELPRPPHPARVFPPIW